MVRRSYVAGGMPPGVTVSYNHAPDPVPDYEARELMGTVRWCQQFELRPGLSTPEGAAFPAAAVCDALGLPTDLTGRRALDIGAGDGAIAFELERRGAEAYALDGHDPARVGFAVARKIIGSRVPHVRAGVYQLDRLGLGLFDHAVFKGVFYQLKYPVLAFEQIAKSLKVGGRAHIEGETALNYAEDMAGNRVAVDLRALNELKLPVCLSYPNMFKGGSNWFVPNLACMEGWLTACGMRVVSMRTWESDELPYGGQRLLCVAEKVSEVAEQVEHPLG